MNYFDDKGILYRNSNNNNGVPILLINNQSKSIEITEHAMKLLKPFGFRSYEIITSYDVFISNLSKYRLSNIEFEKIISSFSNKFGKIIIEKCPIDVNSKNNDILCQKKLVMMSPAFINPFINEIKGELYKNAPKRLIIPPDVAPSIIVRVPIVMKAVFDWVKENKLNLKLDNGAIFGKTKDVENALNLLKVNKPKIPFKAYPIPHGYDINRLALSKKRYYFVNKATKELFVPDTETDENILEYLQQFQNDTQSKTDKTLGNDEIPSVLADEIGCCENPATQSKNPVNIFFKDGTVVSRPICLTCARDAIKYSSLKNLIDQNDEIKIDELLEVSEIIDEFSLYPCTIDTTTQIYWPIIPFCQFMWTLLSSPISSQTARAYFTVIVSIMIHKSPMFVFCPIHPKYLYNASIKKCRCLVEGCNQILCIYCKQWHAKNDKCPAKELLTKVPPGFRKCPNCGQFVEKTSACNHISCSCGKHFCYYCGAGPFNTSDECYDHMSKTENVERSPGRHWEFPPDWYRYIEKPHPVSDDVLNRFFDAYPQFRPV